MIEEARGFLSSAIASGGVDVNQLTDDTVQEAIDAALDEPVQGTRPAGITDEDWALRKALGVA